MKSVFFVIFFFFFFVKIGIISGRGNTNHVTK